MADDEPEITALLKRIGKGDGAARERLFSLMYAELHRLAKAQMQRERPDHTLQPTALINEAYTRLANGKMDLRNRKHFLALAARVMRCVLVDHARARNANIRGGPRQKVELLENMAISEDRHGEIIAVGEALDLLEKTNSRQAQIVELRFFAGLSLEEVAKIVGVTTRTVKRDWTVARLWLFQQMKARDG
jgi:RNA polymerase sigma factor (TIGR02999 family)